MNDNTKASVINKIWLVPVIIFAAIVPLVVCLKIMPLDPSIIPYWTGQKTNYDYFSYYKSLLIIISAALITVLLVISFRLKIIRQKYTWLYLPLAFYIILLLLSASFAEFPGTSLLGAPDRYEGLLVLLAYPIMWLAIINLLQNEVQARIIIIALLISAAIIGIIGIFQYYGIDLLLTVIGKSMSIASAVGTLTQMVSKHSLYSIDSTLYNPNYVAMYMCMLWPFTVALFIKNRSFKAKLLLGILSCLFFANLMGAGGRGGYLGALAGIILLFILMYKQIKTDWKAVTVLMLCFLIILLVMDLTSTGKITGRISAIFNHESSQSKSDEIWQPQDNLTTSGIEGIFHHIPITLGNQTVVIKTQPQLKITVDEKKVKFFSPSGKELKLVKTDTEWYQIDNRRYNHYGIHLDGKKLSIKYKHDITPFLLEEGYFRLASQASPPLADILLDNGQIQLSSEDYQLYISLENKQLTCRDQNGKTVDMLTLPSGSLNLLKDARFPDYAIFYKDDWIHVHKGSKYIPFYHKDKQYYYINNLGQPVEILNPVKSWGFSGYEELFSSRGYIWSRSLPMLKETILLGHGPDTYFIYFPQYDYKGKFMYLHSTYMTVDKPHNLYLQKSINTGILSLVFLLIFWGGCLYSMVKFARQNSSGRSHFKTQIVIASAAACLAYMISGLTYDTNVSVTPVFWCLLSLGTAGVLDLS